MKIARAIIFVAAAILLTLGTTVINGRAQTSTANGTYFGIPLPPLGPSVPVAQALDIHPETKSRAVLWTEYDGNYLVDPNNRAEMLDFANTVLLAPYPNMGWTGNAAAAIAGATSPNWRQREYSQLIAYRSVFGAGTINENSALLPVTQATALVFAQNNNTTHNVPTSWIGYNAIAAAGAQGSNIGGLPNVVDPAHARYGGMVDAYIEDQGVTNYSTGHRLSLLSRNLLFVSLGGSVGTNITFSVLPADDPDYNYPTPTLSSFDAWPGPGYFPARLEFGYYTDPGYRWSFIPTLISTISPSGGVIQLTGSNPTVNVTINGNIVAPQNVSVTNSGLGPISWEFARSDLNFQNLQQDATVDVRVHGYLVRGTPVDYHYVVKALADTVITPVAVPASSSKLIALSTRGTIGSGSQVLIGGFIVSGSTPLKVVFRGQGPGLGQYGISNPSAGLNLQLYQQGDSSTLLGNNSGWSNGPHWRLIQSYQLNPSQASEPAIAATLWPGVYTTVLSASQGGVGLVEAYIIDGQSSSQLTALSTRGLVGTGENQLIGGFILSQTTQVLVRTQGPTLATYGVSGAATATMLRIVRQSDGATMGANTQWANDPANASLLPGGVNANYAPKNANEAALIITLPAGAYTALVSTPNEPGVGLIEVYQL